MTKIAVTGSTGNLGSRTLKHLLTLIPPSDVIASVFNPESEAHDSLKQKVHTGFIYIIRCFLFLEVLFVITSISTALTSLLQLQGVEVRQGDFNNPTTLVSAFKGADKLFLVIPSSFSFPFLLASQSSYPSVSFFLVFISLVPFSSSC